MISYLLDKHKRSIKKKLINNNIIYISKLNELTTSLLCAFTYIHVYQF